MFAMIERCAAWFPLLIPFVAVFGLWIARLASDDGIRISAERCYFAALLVVAGATLRTIIANDPCWLMHTTSLGVMIVGAVIPAASSTANDSLPFPLGVFDPADPGR